MKQTFGEALRDQLRPKNFYPNLVVSIAAVGVYQFVATSLGYEGLSL